MTYEPQYFQIQLADLRTICPEHPFIVATADLDDRLIVVFNSGELSILVDEDGNPLTFA